jgi:hypothetical protein
MILVMIVRSSSEMMIFFGYGMQSSRDDDDADYDYAIIIEMFEPCTECC